LSSIPHGNRKRHTNVAKIETAERDVVRETATTGDERRDPATKVASIVICIKSKVGENVLACFGVAHGACKNESGRINANDESLQQMNDVERRRKRVARFEIFGVDMVLIEFPLHIFVLMQMDISCKFMTL
jgi:hypothetical protein